MMRADHAILTRHGRSKRLIHPVMFGASRGLKIYSIESQPPTFLAALGPPKHAKPTKWHVFIHYRVLATCGYRSDHAIRASS